MVARGAVTVPSDGVAPRSVLTAAFLLAIFTPVTRRAANTLTTESTVTHIAPAHPGRVTLSVYTAFRAVGLAATVFRLFVSRAAEVPGHSPGYVILPPSGCHRIHPVRAQKRGGQTQGVLLDPH